MIELNKDRLVFSFPDVHPEAMLTIQFQRTLRIPDNGQSYPLPPGLGAFPLRHVDDHAQRLPAPWLERGGVLLPMYQAEAMWLHFQSNVIIPHSASYPFAIKVAAGKINAVSGGAWNNELNRDPQDYMVAPHQPWLDGYCVTKGTIRQFVAMPLGEGFTAEEQITGQAEHGGLQLIVYPMKRAAFERLFPKRDVVLRSRMKYPAAAPGSARCEELCDMGLAPGGLMTQEIHRDPYGPEDWDRAQRSRCFVHILNSQHWHTVTGERPPHQPPTAKQYTQAGLPWFTYYDADAAPLEGSKVLAGLKSVAAKAQEKWHHLWDEGGVTPNNVVPLQPTANRSKVREGEF